MEGRGSSSNMPRRGFLHSLGLAALGSWFLGGRSAARPGSISPLGVNDRSSSRSDLLSFSGPRRDGVGNGRAEEIIPEMKDRVLDAIEGAERLYERRGALTGLPTGLSNFDRMTDGLHPAEMIVIASRPSMGKTALSLTIADHVAVVNKHPVAIFSLELTGQQIVQRLLCSRAKVNRRNLSNGFLSERDFPNLATAATKLADSQIYIDDTARLSIEALRVKATRLKQVHDIRLIVIDSLPLLRLENRCARMSRGEEITEVCFEIKTLAKELRVPVIALAQLNRRPEARPGGIPWLSDLRAASGIERHADLVGLLLRPEYYADDEDAREQLAGAAELIIAKQQNGSVGEVRLKFCKEFARFEDQPDGSGDAFQAG